MLLVAVCTLLVLAPLVVGRWPAGLLLAQWRRPVLVWASLLLQVVVLQAPVPHAVAAALHVATYGAALTFLWLNRRVPGTLVVGAGATTNGVTIALNGGTLPATPDAVAAAGLAGREGFTNSGVLTDPVLPWLGDVFAWPAPLPLANTFSVGDVLIAVGVAIAAWRGAQRLGSPGDAQRPGAQGPLPATASPDRSPSP